MTAMHTDRRRSAVLSGPASRRPSGVQAVGKVLSVQLLIGDLDRAGDVPLYVQAYEGLRDSIVDGRLRGGASMPSTRDMASQLQVSRNTVLLAYDRLQAEGLIESRVGAGTTVATSIPDSHVALPKSPPRTAVGAVEPPRLSAHGHRVVRARRNLKTTWIGPETFSPNLSPTDPVSLETWRKLSDHRNSQRCDSQMARTRPGGLPALRAAIQEYLTATRGVMCSPQQVIVVSGVQDALQLATRVLVDAGEPIWVEDPSDPAWDNVLEAAGASVVHVPVDAGGLDVRAGVALAPYARLAHVTSGHELPLGWGMSEARRSELLEWARDNGSWIVENDAHAEFRYGGRPKTALQSGDTDRVIHVGTFENVLFPSMHLGYIVVPSRLVEAFTAALAAGGRPPSIFDQTVLSDFMAGGHFVRHLRRVRVECAARQAHMVERLHRETDGFLRPDPLEAGMNLVAWLPEGVRDVGVSKALAASGIRVPPLSAYTTDVALPDALVFGFTGFTKPQITFGAKAVGQVVRGLSRRPQLRAGVPALLDRPNVS